MRTVIIVSRCLNEHSERPNFHFKGFFAGQFIKSLKLNGDPSMKWKKGEDYVLYVNVECVRSGILWGQVIRSRALEELTS